MWIKERNAPKYQRSFAQRHKIKEEKNWVGWVYLGSCSLPCLYPTSLSFILRSEIDLKTASWPFDNMSTFQKESTARVQRAAGPYRDNTIQLFSLLILLYPHTPSFYLQVSWIWLQIVLNYDTSWKPSKDQMPPLDTEKTSGFHLRGFRDNFIQTLYIPTLYEEAQERYWNEKEFTKSLLTVYNSGKEVSSVW